MRHSVLAILSGDKQSSRCADALKASGFSDDDISILLPDPYGAQELGFVRRTRVLEGIVVGVIAGGFFGTGFALMASHMQPLLPVAVRILSDQTLSMALAGSAIFAAIAGLAGALVGLSISEYVVCKYDRKTKLSSSLMAVHADNDRQARFAEKILLIEGAQQVRTIDEDTDRQIPVQLAVH
jgi:hypothetical protein